MKIKSRNGITMIITLIVIFVLTLLGVVIWQYGINSVKQADRAYRQKQAYYIARSGAEAFSSHILSETEDTFALNNDLNRAVGITSTPISIGEGTCTLLLKRDQGNIIIEATGGYKGETAKATLKIREIIDTGMPAQVFKNMIFSTGSITLNGNVSFEGTIEANGNISINGANPSYIANSTKNYPRVIFPDNTSTEKIKVNSNSTVILNEDEKFDQITIEKDGILQIDLNGGDTILVANKIYVEGELRIQGSGRLLLYVRNFKTANNKGEINLYNQSLPIESFMVLMPSNGVYDVCRFRGLLYAPGASVSIQGNNAFTGAMVAGNVVNNGNTNITFVNDASFITPSYFDGIETTKTTTIQYFKGNWK
jgi:type II secretory pathway pseudopilin PulG